MWHYRRDLLLSPSVPSRGFFFNLPALCSPFRPQMEEDLTFARGSVFSRCWRGSCHGCPSLFAYWAGVHPDRILPRRSLMRSLDTVSKPRHGDLELSPCVFIVKLSHGVSGDRDIPMSLSSRVLPTCAGSCSVPNWKLPEGILRSVSQPSPSPWEVPLITLRAREGALTGRGVSAENRPPGKCHAALMGTWLGRVVPWPSLELMQPLWGSEESETTTTR